MSYILDALKKSEQQRGQGAIPDVQTVHSSSLNYRNEKKTYWPYLLIGAVLLNLIAIIYFIIDKNKTSDSHTTTTQNTVIENDTKTYTPENNIPVAVHIEEKTGVSATITSKPTVEETTETGKEAGARLIKSEPQASTTPVKQHATPVINHTDVKSIQNSDKLENRTPAKRQENILEFHELPDHMQQQLPSIVISAHVYSSNPAHRSIVINNKFLEEGEYVIDNLILSEITTDGAILNYEGTYFHYGVVSGWQ